VMQRFWDSALALDPPDDGFDSRRFVDGPLWIFVFYLVFPDTVHSYMAQRSLLNCAVRVRGWKE
jgi:hypothetical protein